MKLEGITFFAERPGVSYRYFIELKNSRMSIWMEDRKNKTQCTTRSSVSRRRSKADVISSGNEIPNASATDYAKLRDQQDALERLEKEVKLYGLIKNPSSSSSKRRGSTKRPRMCWDKQESVSFIVKRKWEIKITRSGVYSIHGTLIYCPIDDDGRMMLLKNKECILTVDILDSLNYVERLEKGDVLEVTWTCDFKGVLNHWRMDLLLEHGTGKW
ncbi:hypothetical protein GQ600_8176 [Phytophthora cactorum]|nr:hypothetical protein GQ600_8176 [Phytophthora cactorum]